MVTYVIYEPTHPNWFEKCRTYTEEEIMKAAAGGGGDPQTVAEALDIISAYGYVATQAYVH